MSFEFNGAELRLARIFNGLTLEDVAERVDKTRQYLHKLETSQDKPTAQLLEKLASVLQVVPSFLTATQKPTINEDQFHFRKLFTTRAMIKQVAMARCEMIGRLVSYLDHELKLPDVKIPDKSGATTSDDIERAAELCRNEWGIGLGPIAHMSRLAENVGVVVTTFPSSSKEIDALSVSIERPIIVRSEAKESVCRQRFDIGHELGHFVLHAGVSTGDRTTESQANRFASALLIPRSMMAKLFPRPNGSRLDWGGIREFKLTWKVSKAAILYRARQLDLINDAQCKSGFITLRRTGEAAGEKEDYLIPSENPELLVNSLKVLREKKSIYAEEVSSALGVTTRSLNEIVGFDVKPRSIFITQDSAKRPALYRVK